MLDEPNDLLRSGSTSAEYLSCENAWWQPPGAWRRDRPTCRIQPLPLGMMYAMRSVDILLIRAVRGMVAAAWRAAARATDWLRLSAERTRLPDADFMALLADTPLAAAARRCYSAQPIDRAFCPDGMCAPCCLTEACPESFCFWHAPFACQGMVLLARAGFRFRVRIGFLGSRVPVKGWCC